MQNDYLDTEILLERPNDDLSIGEIRNGKIIFTPKVKLYVISLGYQFVKTIEGKHSENEKIIQEVVLVRNKKLKKGQHYQFDFSIKGDIPATYHGENLKLKWLVKNTVKLDSKSFLTVRNHYLKTNKLSHFQDTPDLLTKKFEVQVSNAHLPYIIDNEKITLEKSGFLPIVLFLVGIFGGTYMLSKFQIEHYFYIWLALVFLLTLLFLFPHFYTSYILKRLQFRINTLEKNQFTINLNLKKNQNQIRKVQVNYSILEEFQERSKNEHNGQEDVYFKTKTNIYESPIIEKHRFSKNITANILDFPEVAYDFVFDFDFPQENLPTTIFKKDLKIIWYLHITVYFIFGLKSKFKQEIEVQRKLD